MRFLKQSSILVLAAIALAYLLGAQIVRYERRAAQQSVASAAELAREPAKPRHAAPPERRLAFGGYPCSGDCSDDMAGYRWAEENAVVDPDDCTGKTGSFIEGCRVYARQQVR